jgi:large repetitive protein
VLTVPATWKKFFKIVGSARHARYGVPPVGLKGLLVLLVAASAVAVVSGALAGGIADDPCPTVAGEHTNTCPAGTVGVAYSIRFHEAEGSGCGPGKQTFTVDSGTFPPGLSLSAEGAASGTPTQAGNFNFYIKMSEPVGEPNCSGEVTEKRFTIPINPGQPAPPPLPELTIGIEQSGIPLGTVGAAYSLAMIANLPDAKTWSIAAGALPPGLSIGGSDGVISGTPTAAGTHSFTVLAVIDAQRSDTQELAIIVRDPLVVAPEPTFESEGSNQAPLSEVGRPYRFVLSATGGSQVYAWTLSAGSLPQGLRFWANGSIVGRPRVEGEFAFAVAVRDSEGRTATYEGQLQVAPRLEILKLRPLRPARVGKVYRWTFITAGGIGPMAWRVPRGRLPRGIRLDRELGLLSGVPRQAGRYRFRIQVMDDLGVRSTRTFLLKVVAPAYAKRRNS